MIEHYALHDKHGRVSAYVTRETSRRPADFSRAPQPHSGESPTVEVVCRIVGAAMLVAIGLIFWLMMTTT